MTPDQLSELLKRWAQHLRPAYEVMEASAAIDVDADYGVAFDRRGAVSSVDLNCYRAGGVEYIEYPTLDAFLCALLSFVEGEETQNDAGRLAGGSPGNVRGRCHTEEQDVDKIRLCVEDIASRMRAAREQAEAHEAATRTISLGGAPVQDSTP